MNQPAGPQSETVTADPSPVNLDVGHADGKVVLRFDRPIEVLALDPKTARRWAEVVRQTSHKVEGKK
jgi:hypothetical protein